MAILQDKIDVRPYLADLKETGEIAFLKILEIIVHNLRVSNDGGCWEEILMNQGGIRELNKIIYNFRPKPERKE